jgi:hypothetical protein
MVDCKPVSTPVHTQAKVSTEFEPPVADPTHFKSLVGPLQYLTFTHPDITYVVQQIYLHMHDPQEQPPHNHEAYLWGNLDFRLLLQCSAFPS